MKKVDPRYTNPTTKQVDVFIITLFGHFKHGMLKAEELEYKISADGTKFGTYRGSLIGYPTTSKTNPYGQIAIFLRLLFKV